MLRAFLPLIRHAAGPLGAILLSVGCASAQTRAGSSDPAGSPEVPAASAPAVPAQASPWLVSDSAGQAVTIALQVTPAPDGGAALINGRRNGGLQVVVPLNWMVQWDWRSADSTAAHSLVVMVEREKLPTEGGRAAFTNAMTRMVTAGLRPGQGDRTTFTVDEAGWYWLLCGVPGHALAGEYIGLRVDPDASAAYVNLK